MIPFDMIAAFTIAALVLALVPGPDNLFVLAQSALNGSKAGLFVVLGLSSGLVVHSAAVALGVAALIKASAAAFTLLKIAGAAYLLYLAWQAFRTPMQGHGPAGNVVRLRGAQLYRRGLIMNVTNPKVAIFFLAFFPQFTDPAWGPMSAQIAILGADFMLVTLVVFSSVALVAGGLRAWLTSSPAIQATMNRIAGMIFIGLAVKIAASHR